MKNKYIKRSHISERKTRGLIKCFALDLTATQTAEFVGLNINTVDRVFSKIRIRIFEKTLANSPSEGEFEADESYFGPRRVKGKRGRGSGSKTIVFGLFKRDGKVYTEIVPDAKAKTLQAIIRGKADIESIIHTDGWRAYDGLVDLGYEKHFRVNHSENEFSKGNGNHINGIESFWGFAKHRLSKFKGIPKDKFEIYLKETEFRFNNRGNNLYHLLLKEFR
ncbi:IS1595 family transposase, partial [Clostridiaceae bacterium OttesenSCG-928-D20]|nr:IS1595 family transposase [Clostridiaceae bacterium OttesenSCG-928-D20]